MAKAGEAADLARRALNETDKDVSGALWLELLGNSFPCLAPVAVIVGVGSHRPPLPCRGSLGGLPDSCSPAPTGDSRCRLSHDTRLQVLDHGSNGPRISGRFRWRRSFAALQSNIYRSGPGGIWWCLDRRSTQPLGSIPT